MRHLLRASAVLVAWAGTASAQRAIDGKLTAEGFDDYTGAGLASSPGAGELDTDDWRVLGLADGACNFAEPNCNGGGYSGGSSIGGTGTAGLYAFEVEAGNTAFGVQQAAQDLTPGSITWRLGNQTGATIDVVSFEYTLWIYDDQSNASSIVFAYSQDDVTYTDVPELGGASPGTATGAAWVSSRKTFSLTDLGLADGGTLYLRWTVDDTATGQRDEIAFDDVTVRMPGCGSGIVEDVEICDDGNEDAGDGCAADCTATEAGFLCAGTSPTVCDDIDECADALDDCGAHATCDNVPGSFECACDAGYQGDGITCADIDECQDGTHDCSSDAACSNTAGSWDCCDPGFQVEGGDCVDVDECAEDLAGCDADATCVNTSGAFECDCNPGFGGDGISCVPSDGDGDGVDDPDDNCPREPNQDQADTDGDGDGDQCDFTSGVDDGGGGGCGCRAGGSLGGGGIAPLLIYFLMYFATCSYRGYRGRRGCSRCSGCRPGCTPRGSGCHRPGR
jgi:hypothetical protein